MKYLLSLSLFMFCGIVSAQQNCTAILLDGSKVHGTLMDKSIEISTSYGTLNVPWNEIRNIKLGLHYPEGVKKEIDEAIKELGHDAYKKRDEATKKLAFLGRHSYLRISDETIKENDTETKRRAEAIKKKIEEDIPASEIRSTAHDLIVAKEAILKGKITTSAIKIKTKHLGDVDLKLCTLDNFYLGFSGGEFKIDAAKYGMKPNTAWFDTKVYVSDQGKWSIKARGSVDLWAQGPGQYMATPKGNTNNTNFGGWPSGALIGKVGENGKEFLIGESYTAGAAFSQDTSGNLYLRINSSAWENSQTTGFYEVTIQ